MATAKFAGQVISINKYEGGLMAVVTRVDFVMMVRAVEMNLHKHIQSNNYWQPLSFSCPARAPYKLQNALNELTFGDYITVIAEKDEKGKWNVTGIEFAKNKATDFRSLIKHNEEIL